MFEIIHVGKLQAYLIRKFKVPYGLYWTEDDGSFMGEGNFVGIDNTKGEAITQVFSSFEIMADWFNGEFKIEDIETWEQKMLVKK